jgi:hypothetical protein
MTGGGKGDSFSVVLDGFLKILHLSQLLKASANGIGKAIEGCGAIWVAGR